MKKCVYGVAALLLAMPLSATVVLTEDFESGAPGWVSINNEVGNPVTWVANLTDCGEAANYTNGSGLPACASSELQAGGSGAYDTELRTPFFDLSAFSVVTLGYTANYQNNGDDLLDLDVSTNGGASWTNLLSWQESHGALRATPGEDVNVDLSTYAGNASVLLRWHYYDPVGPAASKDLYAQIDNVTILGDPAEDAIPEPGTWLLSATGIALLWIGKRRAAQRSH
jgi:hypothetical protein